MNSEIKAQKMIKKILLSFTIFLGITIFGIISGVGILAYYSFDLPNISTLADYHPPIPSKILSADGTILAQVGIENREVAPFSEISKRVVDAFLSAEDDSFYEHQGVDYLGVFRAFLANLRAGKVVQGGSTITQQVAKSLLLSRERSIVRKIKDFLLAQRIEKKFSKQDILFLYLNQVYLGGGYYGVKAAFKGYFDKYLSEASIAESAMVAGLLVAPGRYSPYVNPKYTKRRQSYVLKRMFETGKITQSEYSDALRERIKFRIRKKKDFLAGYFTDWIRQRVIAKVGEKNFLRNGFEVKTTIDYELQKKAEKYILDGVKAIDKRQGFKGPIGSIDLLEDLRDHEIVVRKKAYKSSSNFFTLDDDFNRVYELEFNEERFDLIKEERSEILKEIKSSRFLAGNIAIDTFKPLLKKDIMYEAIVLKTDNWARLIYVSVGGVHGIIPYRYFRWAHERVIDDKRHFYPYITKPGTIVSEGDKILVSIKSFQTSIWVEADSKFKKAIEDKDYVDQLKQSKFLLCLLDQKADAQGALVSLTPTTGEIKAFVGGSDFQLSQFNRAVQSMRQPGSSFKPILYAAALENGYTPASIILDSPEALGGVDESLNWKPRNYDGSFKGPITLRFALEHSRNVPAIKVAQDISVKKIKDFTSRIGLNAKLPPDLSIALGSFGTTLLDITSTYAMFPNGGKLVDAISIVSIMDRYGTEYEIDENIKRNWIEKQAELKRESDFKSSEDLGSQLSVRTNSFQLKTIREDAKDKNEKINPYLFNLNDTQVYDTRLAYLMTKLLQGVVLNGTGRKAKDVSSFLGGKTGTTNMYIDALFIGFSANVVTGVWTGFDNNGTLGWGETGAKAALPIWRKFMKDYLEKYGEYDFKEPSGIINVLIDKKKGTRVDEKISEVMMEVFVDGMEIPGAEREDVNLDDSETEEKGTIFEDDAFFNVQ